MSKLYQPQSIELTKPDDWHVHFRQGHSLKSTVAATAKHFSRALIMPNLTPPLTTVDAIDKYKSQITSLADKDFHPFFTLYLTDKTDVEEMTKASHDEDILGAKLYPQGATTNASAGVSTIKSLYPIFEAMQQLDLVLQIHGETTKDDIFEREAKFIEEELKPLVHHFPKLRIVLEHISTKTACDFVFDTTDKVAATITPQHLLYNRNDLLAGGIKPHFYCLPILKKESDQSAVGQAAISGNPKFFLGTDSAPHAINQKESACGCAGIFSAPYALSLYAEFFEQHEALDKLNDFASVFGARFYQKERNKDSLLLIKKPQTIPARLPFGENEVVPIAAGNQISWTVDNEK